MKYRLILLENIILELIPEYKLEITVKKVFGALQITMDITTPLQFPVIPMKALLFHSIRLHLP
jgi:hypothetical protein